MPKVYCQASSLLQQHFQHAQKELVDQLYLLTMSVPCIKINDLMSYTYGIILLYSWKYLRGLIFAAFMDWRLGAKIIPSKFCNTVGRNINP